MRINPRFMAVALAGGALAGLGAMAVPAQAAAGNTLVGSGNYTGVLLNGITVVYECHAVATGAVSTAVNSCRLTTGGAAPARALPGETSATAGTSTVPFKPFQLCWTVSATYLDASTKTSSGCTLLPSAGGVPTLAGTGVSTA